VSTGRGLARISPWGLILCAKQRQAVAHYALEGLANKILAAEYRTTLPDAHVFAAEMERAQLIVEERKRLLPKRGVSVAGKRSRKPRR
jgi:hypothetical protein